MLVLAASQPDAGVLIQQLVNGITVGGIYALVALGYTLVYGIIELINFAHGDVFVWGSVVTTVVLQRMLGTSSRALGGIQLVAVLVLILAIAMLFCALLNVTIERIAYRPLRKAPRLAPLIAAIAVSFILENVIRLWLGSDFISYPSFFPSGAVQIGDVSIRYLYIFIVVLALALMYALNWFIQTSKIGKAMRATAQDPEAASLMGVNINRTISITFLIGGALAGAGGVVYELYATGVRNDSGFELGLIAFTAAVLGGIGNIYGAVLGGFMIGLIQALTVQFIPGGIQWTDAAAFIVLVLIFVVRPSGLLGQQVPDKA